MIINFVFHLTKIWNDYPIVKWHQTVKDEEKEKDLSNTKSIPWFQINFFITPNQVHRPHCLISTLDTITVNVKNPYEN